MLGPDQASVLVRTVAFVALFQAAGAVSFLLLFARRLNASAAAVARLGGCSAALGVAALAVHQALHAARMAGDYSGLWDGDLQRLAWNSTSALSHEWQIVGLVLIAAGMWRARDGWRWLVLAGAALALAGFLITGHTSIHPLRPWLAALLMLHLAVIAFWFGSLWPLLLTLRRETALTAHFIWRRFSTVAGWLVPLIAIAGLAMALMLIPDLSGLRQPYGLLLLFKAAAFALLMLLASLNRWRWLPLLDSRGAAAGPSLRRSVIAEIVVIVVVLAATAVMTTFYSPG